jgi:hypothetical protein
MLARARRRARQMCRPRRRREPHEIFSKRAPESREKGATSLDPGSMLEERCPNRLPLLVRGLQPLRLDLTEPKSAAGRPFEERAWPCGAYGRCVDEARGRPSVEAPCGGGTRALARSRRATRTRPGGLSDAKSPLRYDSAPSRRSSIPAGRAGVHRPERPVPRPGEGAGPCPCAKGRGPCR